MPVQPSARERVRVFPLNVRISQERIEFQSLGQPIAGVLFLPGDGGLFPALVISHGYMDFKENYFELCGYLAQRGVASLVMDMHGHGESGGERYHIHLDEWIADIRAAMDVLQAHPSIDPEGLGAFGLSSGGTAVLEAALVDSRIRALITLDATVRPLLSVPERIGMGLLSTLGRIKRFLTGRDLRVSLVREVGKVEAAHDPEVNEQWRSNPRVVEMWSSFPFPGSEASVYVDTLTRVHRITVPTLVLHGAQDRVDSPQTAHMLFDALTCPKELHIIEGNGHLGHLDRNKGMVMELTAGWALSRLKGSGRPSGECASSSSRKRSME
ncbi:Tropinesterase [anaerobic digester metagenome]|uniref:Tropinesterase n=1 Tax=anaerobic digester metagenome TaxID=1263854 RepID=A0A485M0U9_9ZZZZ